MTTHTRNPVGKASAPTPMGERFAAAVHDLKTPLLGIRHLADLILEQETLTEDGQRRASLIRSSVVEAIDRIDEVLTEGTESLPEWDFVPVDMGALTRRIIQDLRPHAEFKQQVVQVTLPSDQCIVYGDEPRLRDALVNLVGNALKYSPLGGTIQVRVWRQQETVHFSVTDAGPGFSAEEQTHLFRPLHPLGAVPTAGERPLGLGLYLTRQIAVQHGGTVEVESKMGEGSTFVLILPAADLSSLSDLEESASAEGDSTPE